MKDGVANDLVLINYQYGHRQHVNSVLRYSVSALAYLANAPEQ